MRRSLGLSAFWTDGYYVSTVGKHASEEVISRYVREQGSEKEYRKLHKVTPLQFF